MLSKTNLLPAHRSTRNSLPPASNQRGPVPAVTGAACVAGEWLQAHHKKLFLPSIAITALDKNAGLLLLTRNLKHFQPLGVACIDPLVSLPAEP